MECGFLWLLLDMENKDILPEDVIEIALMFGIKTAMVRFNLTEKKVMEIVTPFTDEIDGVNEYCNCEISRMNGIPVMCLICDKISKKRKIY